MKTQELYEAYKEELEKVVKGVGDTPGRMPSGGHAHHGNVPDVVRRIFVMPFDEEAFEAACKRVGVGTSESDLDEMVKADSKAEDEARKKKYDAEKLEPRRQAAELAKKLAAANKKS